MELNQDMYARPAPGRTNAEANRDLGFGAVVASESRQRLLNRDGSFNVQRTGLSFWASFSLYHSLINMDWWRFLSTLTASYLLINAAFAASYLLCGPGALTRPAGQTSETPFWQAFFFSVQTFSTIGYGNVSPVGVAANAIVTIESFVGLLAVALATGLMFARFSRPTAKILFSRQAVVGPYRDIGAFMFRVSNARRSQIIKLTATVLFARFEIVDGKRLRRFYPLHLERHKVEFFPLTWTIVHPIDGESPLRDLTHEELLETDAEFLVLLTGIEETFTQTVHSRSSYKANEVVWGAKFSDIYNRSASNQLLTVDIRRLDKIERAGI